MTLACQGLYRALSGHLAGASAAAFAYSGAMLFLLSPQHSVGSLVADGRTCLCGGTHIDLRIILDPETSKPIEIFQPQGASAIRVNILSYETRGGLRLGKETVSVLLNRSLIQTLASQELINPQFDPSLFSIESR